MKWTDVPAGVINAAQQRFWVAVGDSADEIADKMCKDPDFLGKLTAFAKNQSKLLKPIATFQTLAVEEFIANENFVEGKTVNGVSTVRLGENFKKNFLGKVEKSVEAVELKIYSLIKAVCDLSKNDEPGIIPELGDKHEIRLAHFFQLLAYKQQKEDYSWTVGYVCDEQGVLWAVNAGWDSDFDGWFVNADSVGDPSRWNADNQVVSR